MSMTVPLYGFGHGGGNALNFEVVSYATEELLTAAKPKENTIGVITDKKITGYHFSATQPESLAEGEVYFNVGTDSLVAFDALKKNTVMVYPVNAKQYVSGAWVDVTAKSYQNGAWVDWWNGELYKNGNEYTDVTGGWTCEGKGYSSDAKGVGTPTITRDETTLTMEITSAAGGAIFYTANKIDLSKYTELVFDGTASGVQSYDTVCNLRVWEDIGSYSSSNVAAYKTIKQATPFDGTVSLDISGLDKTKKYFVGFGLYTANPKVVMRSMILK